MRAAAVAAAAAVVLVAGCGGGGGTTTVTQTVTLTRTHTVTVGPTSGTGTSATAAPACSGSDLDGSFAVVPGSAGAGNISYVLKLENTSSASCFVTGIPNVRLLDGSGKPLPTHVSAARPGQALAAKVTLAPGETAEAEARFSPDVTGVGDRQSGQCQPKAASLRMSPGGGGTLEVPVQPPTPVCEQGSLSFDLLSHS